MSSTISKQTLVVAGITVNVFAQPNSSTMPAESSESPRPADIAILFLLHGRTQSAETVEPVARSILEDVHEHRKTPLGGTGGGADELIVVTFDHRNHGKRLVDTRANWHWTDDPETTNVRHAVDMYAIQTGTAADVSFLIDFLPAYLFPHDERTVGKWLVAGISLGGHATWIVLKNEPRVTLGIPIIGCPDYLKLMSARAKESGIALAPPHFPASFVGYVRAHDPASTAFTAAGGANPFWGKKVLVLSGKEDVLVPWSASEAFVQGLDVGTEEGGVKEVLVEEGTGHACSEGMIRRAAGFVWEHALVR
ncbi:Alpha/Beta hydrolase protein [Trametes meyenii]|nr:Alpha/Beta hydrolase protein [Trametes meyenii]